MTLWRQGDILIQLVDEFPEKCTEIKGRLILAQGEATGHNHEVHPRSGARLFRLGMTFYLEVIADEIHVKHQEHDPITLAKGKYKVWRQREFGVGWVRD